MWRLAARRADDGHCPEACDLRPEHHAESAERASLPRADEVGDAPGEARAKREQQAVHPVGRVAALASSWFAW